MEEYVKKDGKALRMGYTTGACAAAAAKAAACALLLGRWPDTVDLLTPKGIRLHLEVLEKARGEGWACCAVRKDSGDDPDITNGTLIFARAERAETSGVSVDGGQGIGRVTKPGLDQPVGAAAINSVPRRMIREGVEEVLALADAPGGVAVTISAPEGKALAKKTFNPRLGIVGGISILGTTGIVEPMSEKALVDTIRVELNQRRAMGRQYALITPGNYGSDFLRGMGVPEGIAVQCSNFIGDALDLCGELGFRGVLLVGHIGKTVKLAGNMLNTHSRYGDCRMEILAAYAGAAGLSSEAIRQILDCAACDEAVRILHSAGKAEETLRAVTAAAEENLCRRAGENLAVGGIFFSKAYGILGQTSRAEELLGRILEE